jgi:hypothetical protein
MTEVKDFLFYKKKNKKNKGIILIINHICNYLIIKIDGFKKKIERLDN